MIYFLGSEAHKPEAFDTRYTLIGEEDVVDKGYLDLVMDSDDQALVCCLSCCSTLKAKYYYAGDNQTIEDLLTHGISNDLRVIWYCVDLTASAGSDAGWVLTPYQQLKLLKQGSAPTVWPKGLRA